MDGGISPMKKKKNLARKLTKILKQQEYFDDDRDYHPGKLNVISS